MKLKEALFVIGLLFSTEAAASCFNDNASSRLRSYCVTGTLVGSPMSLENAQVLDTLLQREGYYGFGIWQPISRNTLNTYFTPQLYYSYNINAGNPNRPLILGGLKFTGNDELIRKEGVVAGIAANANGRTIVGEGRYVDYNVSASYAYSEEHSLGIAQTSTNVCSRNYIANQWYVDACGDATRLVRDLSAETTRGVVLSTSKQFSTINGTFHSASFGVRRHYTEDFQQNQVQLGLSTLRNWGAYTALNFNFGETVLNHLSLRRSVSATIGTTLFDKPLNFTISYSYSDGGKLLGFERNDRTRGINISYSFTSNLSLNIGYREVDSTINYFSEREPIVSLQFVPIRF